MFDDVSNYQEDKFWGTVFGLVFLLSNAMTFLAVLLFHKVVLKKTACYQNAMDFTKALEFVLKRIVWKKYHSDYSYEFAFCQRGMLIYLGEEIMEVLLLNRADKEKGKLEFEIVQRRAEAKKHIKAIFELGQKLGMFKDTSLAYLYDEGERNLPPPKSK